MVILLGGSELSVVGKNERELELVRERPKLEAAPCEKGPNWGEHNET